MGAAVGGLHRLSQESIDSSLITFPASFQPCQNIGVQTDGERFLDRPIELPDDCLTPVRYGRNVRRINLPVPHPFEFADFTCAVRSEFPSYAFLSCRVALRAEIKRITSSPPSSLQVCATISRMTPSMSPSVFQRSSPSTTRSLTKSLRPATAGRIEEVDAIFRGPERRGDEGGQG